MLGLPLRRALASQRVPGHSGGGARQSRALRAVHVKPGWATRWAKIQRQYPLCSVSTFRRPPSTRKRVQAAGRRYQSGDQTRMLRSLQSLRAVACKKSTWRGGKWVRLPTYPHCPTRAHCANPACGRVLHSDVALFRPGLARQRRQRSLDPARRATVARSLRARESKGTRRETNAPAVPGQKALHFSDRGGSAAGRPSAGPRRARGSLTFLHNIL